MTAPPGFVVDLVASEPDLVNPVAMCFDERGRIWVTESIEYPRHAPGKGRDRVKILEDTDGDGKADKFTIFAEGLNIPSGIAVCYGGVWVANSPDILFMQDTDGDGKADKTEVVVTGFGRADTHELPNSLTWGPDGYLYGLNGVFNPSHIEQDGKVFDFTCAIWRIDPRTRKFEIFAEGTSNPWGIAFNEDGEMFISACVIDHLWHITQTGYYIRQGGPYPPHTWPMGSIVDHKHQKAAYCGIVWFDSDAWPQQYRRKLFMGNIHGNCINCDALERNGATYRGIAQPDLLSGNDAWFMPVSQKVGPDGNLYILDWYDRYHCYQDANRDPKGIDRLKGRLYRLRYAGPQRAATVRERARAGPIVQNPLPDGRGSFGSINLAAESDDQLIARLSSPNVFIRDTSQRLLIERNNAQTGHKLRSLALDRHATRESRLRAMWVVMDTGRLDVDFHLAILGDPDSTFRAWGIRSLARWGGAPEIVKRASGLAHDLSPDVKLQAAVLARSTRVEWTDSLGLLSDVLDSGGDDPLVPKIAWQNLYPLLWAHPSFIARFAASNAQSSGGQAVAERALDMALERGRKNGDVLEELVVTAVRSKRTAVADHVYRRFAHEIATGAIPWETVGYLRNRLPAMMTRLGAQAFTENSRGWRLLNASWGDAWGLERVASMVSDTSIAEPDRLSAVEALAKHADERTIDAVLQQVESPAATLDYRRSILTALSRRQSELLPRKLVSLLVRVAGEIQPAIVDLLIQRPEGAQALMDHIGADATLRRLINLNQVRALAGSSNAGVRQHVEKIWGKVRTERNPDREKVINATRQLLAKTPGNPRNGQAVFSRICAQCHALYGQGAQIGPDLTSNGRGSFEQLLSNVLDPNLVVGEAYQLRTVTMKDGRTFSGIAAEDSPQRLSLRILGGQVQELPRDQIQSVQTLPLSFMPEGLEGSMTPQELADLFAFLMTDKPPQ